MKKKIKYVSLVECERCGNHLGVVDRVVRCGRVSGVVGMVPVGPSNYFAGIEKNGLDAVRCLK